MKLSGIQLHKEKKGRAGFSLVEILVVVALIAILMGVGIMALFRYQKTLRQRELDSKAEIIYMAAQYRMAELRIGGFEKLYGPDASGVAKAGIPVDADENNEQAKNLYYVNSADKSIVTSAAQTVLPQSSVDAELWDNEWIIEYNPETGTVYAVFYSLEPFAGDGLEVRLNQLRSKDFRLSDGARVGYYGGDLIDVKFSDKLIPLVTITNAEKLIAHFSCQSPNMDAVEFTITVEDVNDAGKPQGHSYTKVVPFTQLKTGAAGSYTYEWVMDSLNPNEGSFFQNTEGKIPAGANIRVTLSVKDIADTTVAAKTADATTNSLFKDYSAATKTATVAYGRHLQNLDSATSQVGLKQKNETYDAIVVENAIQDGDISFMRDDSDPECYHSYYGTAFTPILNNDLLSYKGNATVDKGQIIAVPAIKGLTVVSNKKNVGLFDTFHGTVENLILTGTKVTGTASSNVGGLMGAAIGETTIRNVQLYLSELQGDLQNARLPQGATQDPSQVSPWLQGQNVGGLVGTFVNGSKLSIHNSSASTVVSAENTAGGLVGRANRRVDIISSYSDSYLKGTTTGGLVGYAGSRASIYLQNFYAVGFQAAAEKAAGLVVFDSQNNCLKSATNGYAAVDYVVNPGLRYYILAPKCASASDVFYIAKDGAVTLTGEGLTSITALDLSGNGVFNMGLKAPFTRGTTDVKNASNPYLLMNQNLGAYPYPRLSGMRHYGDWSAEFQDGALVYFEVSNNAYSFWGGNVAVDNIYRNDGDMDYSHRVKLNGDGYALAFLAPRSATSVSIQYNGKDVYLSTANRITVTAQGTGTTYYLYPLDAGVLNNDDYLRDTFYQNLYVKDNGTEHTYYFNPNFAKCISENIEEVPTILRIRSPRQLFALSRLYARYSALFTPENAVFQEMDLDYTVYNWQRYYGAAFTSQNVIGTEAAPFVHRYDGQGYTVLGANVSTQENYAGLFGTVGAQGQISNVALLSSSKSTTVTHKSAGAQDGGAEATLTVASGNKTVGVGALAGRNQGRISNCAAAGFSLSASGYNGVQLYVGGLVGSNEGGTIRTSSADTPSMVLTSYQSDVYGGGMVGRNSGGSVIESYAFGAMNMAETDQEHRNTYRISGFAGDNASGTITRCYAGMALVGGGDTEIYGFTRTGGTALGCYYLDGGTYSYRDEFYSFNTATNEFAATAQGAAVSGEWMANNMKLTGFNRGATALHTTESTHYPYPASVRRGDANVHYGDWPSMEKNVGEFGVFYWEQETGKNGGVHITFQGTANGLPTKRYSTLCTAHDDGGEVVSYGYGYYYKPDAALTDNGKPYLETQDCTVPEEENAGVEATLKKEFSQYGYEFVAYTTGDSGLRMDTAARNHSQGNSEHDRNATWKLYYPVVKDETGALRKAQCGEYTYSVSPFFADAFSLDSIRLAPYMNESGDSVTPDTVATNFAAPGSKDVPYQVRSLTQLQYINWNYVTGNATTSIESARSAIDSSLNYETIKDWNVSRAEAAKELEIVTRINGYYFAYPYLSYGHADGINNIWAGCPKDVLGEQREALNLSFVQSHDVGSGSATDFTPIGGMNDCEKLADKFSKSIMAYFTSSYDGQAYTIKNIQITSNAQCLGLFGVTVDANIHDVLLYGNTDGAVITHEDSSNWYCVGGLVGLAGQTGANKATFENCTVSGYTIRDKQSRDPGWGGGSVGGMVGATTMNITGCTAVNTIDIAISYNGGSQNCRVAGLAGCARAVLNNCYAGGEIISSVHQKTTDDRENSACIWVSGISGGIVLRTEGNLKDLIGSVTTTTTLNNCYSYTKLPGSVFDNVNGNGVKSSNSIASNGELQSGFADVAGDNYIVINNCYALASAVEETREYKWFTDSTWTFEWNYENINPFEKKSYGALNRTQRGIRVYNNGHSPYIDYGDMQAQALCELLNTNNPTGVAGTFHEVTKTENGVETEGKFTFAGGDPQLEGMNYPFPAVLTQNGSYVHYGVWPKHGLYWESKRATLDLVTDRNTTGQSLLPEEDELQPVVVAPEEEKSAEAPKAETPETPKAETPETPKAETPETPKAETPETPKVETPETPKTETPERPKTQGADLPKMEIVEAPQEAETPEPVENSQENKDTGDAPEESPVTPDLPEPKEENRVADAPEEPENPNQELVARFMANAVPLEAKALQATLDFRLYVIDLAGDLSGMPTYSLYTEDGKLLETEEDIAGAAASFLVEGAVLESDDTGSFYTSTFLGQHPGVVKVKAELGGYSATFTLTVTTTLEISVVPEGTEITVYEGETAKDISIALTDGTSPFTPGEDAVLEWGLQLNATEDILSWDKQFIEPAEDGSFTLTGLKGLQGGDGSLTLTLTYTWGKSEGITAEPKLLQLSIPVTVYSSDVLGLSDGESFNQVSIPHTPKASDITKGGEVEYEQEDAPDLGEEGLFLYVTSMPDVSYTDLEAFTVKTAELKVGTGGYQTMKLYEPKEGEPPVTGGKRYDCTIGETTYSMTLDDGLTPGANTDFAYRLLTVDGVGDEQWSLRLSLTGENGKTYVLTYQRPNTVSFVYQEEGEDGTVTQQKLADYRVPQDTAFASAYKDLTEDTLSADLVQKAADKNITLPTLEEGKHWVWKIPQGKLTGNRTVAQQQESIRYQVKYNVNYPDADMDDNTDMPNSTFTYGEESNHLAKCTYQRPGYKFLGWAMAADAAAPDYPYNAETDSYEKENFVDDVPQVDGKPIEHGETLELYALWELQTYTITLNYRDDVTGDATKEFNAEMESEALPVPSREGYTFKGWAVNADGSSQLLTQGATLEDAARQETGERVSYTSRTLYAVWEKIEEVAANEMPEEEETVIAPEKAAAPEPVSTPAETPAEPTPDPKPTPEPTPEPEEEPEEKTESEEDSPEEKTEDA